ncbi:MAG: phosphomannomutase/phosphoglucomutase [Actinomycetota bacterium]
MRSLYSGAVSSLDDIFKKYDIRGLVGKQLNERIIKAVGAAFVDEMNLAGNRVVVGHDMRDSSIEYVDAFCDGAMARGADVISIGLCSTDESYFASGHLDAAAAMFTASHNPATYNGIKLSRAGARGISSDTGLLAIRNRAEKFLEEGIEEVEEPGYYSEHHILGEYAAYLRSLVDLSGIRPLKIVVDAANGMAGMTAPAVLGTASDLPKLPLEIIPLYFELDGSFPNHEANPLDPKNLVDLQKAVLEHGADLGLAFDGDADRCFVIDEKGNPVSPSAVASVVSLREIERVKAKGESDIKVLHNLICSRAVAEFISQAGATPIRTRVGHSLIKDEMARTGAIFGGEHSAHYYFRDFFGADNGMLAALHLLAEFGSQEKPLSEFARRFNPYFESGEINSVVPNKDSKLAAIKAEFADFESDDFDGLTVAANPAGEPWWWFNVRGSNTEELLRLNVESSDPEQTKALTERLLGIIRSS